MNPQDASPESETAASLPKAWKYRTLFVVAVASPFVVGGAVAVLIADTLAHSWLWGIVGLVAVLLLFGLVIIALIRSGRRNPEAAQAYVAAYGRAMSGFPLRSVAPVEDGRSESDGPEP